MRVYILPSDVVDRLLDWVNDEGDVTNKTSLLQLVYSAQTTDIPPVAARRPFDDDRPNGYLESDADYVHNNLEAAVALLDGLTNG